jgi:hypothetical protein
MDNISQNARWIKFWESGYGKRIVDAAEFMSNNRVRNEILNYLYQNDYPTPADCALELAELRRGLSQLMSELEILDINT